MIFIQSKHFLQKFPQLICLYSKKIFRNLGVTSQKFPLFPPVFSSQKKFPPRRSGKMACFWMWVHHNGTKSCAQRRKEEIKTLVSAITLSHNPAQSKPNSMSGTSEFNKLFNQMKIKYIKKTRYYMATSFFN